MSEGGSNYYRKGLGMRGEILPALEHDYRSALVDYLRTHGRRLKCDDTTVVLAREFGFCYGVDRAVEYAYEARLRFPDKRIFITGEIIHNPWVNQRLQEMGIRRLPPPGSPGDRFAGLRREDVALIPAFGIEQEELRRLRELGAILVDTTCGSVLNVWKAVARYARQDRTSIIHGKVEHEETRATCSQVLLHGGEYVVVRDLDQARRICAFIEGRADLDGLLSDLRSATSPGFDPRRHLERIGLANQTTMLSSESLRIAEALRASFEARHGEDGAAERFASFETICSATQDRQDAVEELLQESPDLLLVIGGFNSSNTAHLVEIGRGRASTYHVQSSRDLISGRWIRHKPLGDPDPVVEGGWLPPGPILVGLTAGASTPNSEIGRTIERLLGFRGIEAARIANLIAGEEQR
ncbi:MAG: 4-hydroxy-3-methylbut-2-enyl diphosphate reductase [Candidatus Eisenbacteria bacterium]|nr:4-hydroxy-3-methylbut-2-enyl diphosphate reductase [Candidatus Eisenbacteria bacterium]